MVFVFSCKRLLLFFFVSVLNDNLKDIPKCEIWNDSYPAMSANSSTVITHKFTKFTQSPMVVLSFNGNSGSPSIFRDISYSITSVSKDSVSIKIYNAGNDIGASNYTAIALGF